MKITIKTKNSVYTYIGNSEGGILKGGKIKNQDGVMGMFSFIPVIGSNPIFITHNRCTLQGVNGKADVEIEPFSGIQLSTIQDIKEVE